MLPPQPPPRPFPASRGGRVGRRRRRETAVTSLMAGAPLSISIVIPTLNAGRAFGTVLHRIMGPGRGAVGDGRGGSGLDGRDPAHREPVPVRPFRRGCRAGRTAELEPGD